MLSLLVALLLSANAQAQDANCDYRQNVQPNTRYLIRSLNYPNSYPRSVQCRWIGQCPAGYKCRLDCFLEMPQTQGCTGDRILISKSGDPQLSNAEIYCERQTLAFISDNQTIVLGMISTSNSVGGRFMCNLTAQAVPPSQQQCVCGIRKQNRIVGGTETGVNEYTMMAGLIDNIEKTVFCGATIINIRFGLTAAHCILDRTPTGVLVSVGNRNYTQGTKYKVTRFATHNNFNMNNYDYDIGLVNFATNIIFNSDVTPVCLPFQYRTANIDGIPVTVLGWGTIFFGGPTSTNLRQVDVNVTSQQSCRTKRPSVTSRQLCTNTPGKDSCQDDSGGPALATSATSGSLFLMGIVSYGDGCGSSDQPSVYTRITEFLDWITTNAPGDYCSSQ